MEEFESLILKSLLNDRVYFTKVFNILDAKYFSNFASSKLFSLIKDYYSKYKEIPSEVSIIPLIRDTVNADTRKELAAQLKNVHSAELVSNTQFMLDETVKFVKDAIYLEALTIGSEGLAEKSDSKKKKAQRLFEEMAKVEIDENIGLQFSDIEEMIRYYQERNIGILTQHDELNKRLGTGFLPGTLSVILAAQSVGKSLMMCDLISGMLLQKKNILLVSLEMSDHEMMKRIQANVFGIDINTFTDISKTPEELSNISRHITTKDEIINAYNSVKDKVGKFYVKDYPTGSFSSLMLEGLVEKIQTKDNIKFDCIFIDYLGIMKSDLVSPNVGTYTYIKSIGEELRGTAKKLGTAIISASQLHRAATNKVEGVDNSAISDSMGTAMTSDWMMFLLQNEEMKEKCEIVCKVTKNRFNGRTDTWMMNIDYPHMRFKDMIKSSDQLANNIIKNNTSKGLDADFGIVTSEKLDKATKFANDQIAMANSIKSNSDSADVDNDFLSKLDLL